MLSWETGVQFGQALEQIRSHEARLTHVEAEVTSLRSIIIRGGLLLALAAAGALTNISAETAGEAAASFVKALRK